MDYVEFFQLLEGYGLTDALLPFLLIFTIIFAVMQKTKILGVGKKNFNVIIALVMAFTAIVPHITGSYPSDFDVVVIINTALPQVSLIAVAFIMLLLLVGLFGAESRWMGASLSGWLAILSFIIIVVIFGGAAGWWESLQDIFWWWDDDATALVIIILVFAVLIWYVTRPDTREETGSQMTNIMDRVGKYFGGGGSK